MAAVRTPAYVRDNIHVSLLAAAYVAFAAALPGSDSAFSRVNPSGYVESQGAFAERVSREIRARTGWECKLQYADQVAFSEPRIRINTDALDTVSLGWNESIAWDEFAQWYKS